jgi:hypothetical protein
MTLEAEPEEAAAREALKAGHVFPEPPPPEPEPEPEPATSGDNT